MLPIFLGYRFLDFAFLACSVWTLWTSGASLSQTLPNSFRFLWAHFFLSRSGAFVGCEIQQSASGCPYFPHVVQCSRSWFHASVSGALSSAVCFPSSLARRSSRRILSSHLRSSSSNIFRIGFSPRLGELRQLSFNFSKRRWGSVIIKVLRERGSSSSLDDSLFLVSEVYNVVSERSFSFFLVCLAFPILNVLWARKKKRGTLVASQMLWNVDHAPTKRVTGAFELANGCKTSWWSAWGVETCRNYPERF